jgi:hypothetical protein
MSQNFVALVQTVKTHEDTLYRHNGVKGVVATLDDLVGWKKVQDESEKEKKDESKEWKHFKWDVYSSLALVTIDLVLRLLKIV